MAAFHGAFCSVFLWQGVFAGADTLNGNDVQVLIEAEASVNPKTFAKEEEPSRMAIQSVEAEAANVPVVSADPVVRARDSGKSVPGSITQDELEDEDKALGLAQLDEVAGRLQEEISEMIEAVVQRDARINEMQAKVKDLAVRLLTADRSQEECEATCEAKCDARCEDQTGTKKSTCKPADCPVGWKPLSSPPTTCKDTTCNKRECCEKFGTCQNACDCGDGWKPLSSLPTNCKDTQCEKGECCEQGSYGPFEFSSSDGDK